MSMRMVLVSILKSNEFRRFQTFSFQQFHLNLKVTYVQRETTIINDQYSERKQEYLGYFDPKKSGMHLYLLSQSFLIVYKNIFLY